MLVGYVFLKYPDIVSSVLSLKLFRGKRRDRGQEAQDQEGALVVWDFSILVALSWRLPEIGLQRRSKGSESSHKPARYRVQRLDATCFASPDRPGSRSE